MVILISSEPKYSPCVTHNLFLLHLEDITGMGLHGDLNTGQVSARSLRCERANTLI